jgi:hypothetical protein
MKNFFIILSLFLLNYSCDKDDLDINDLNGKWVWLSSSGGISGETYTPESTGKIKIIEFTADSIFRSYQNDTLVVETKYHLIKSKSIYDQDTTYIITYDKQEINQSFSFDRQNLMLKDECFDCFESFYKKAK